MGVIIARAVTLYAGGADSGCVVGNPDLTGLRTMGGPLANRNLADYLMVGPSSSNSGSYRPNLTDPCMRDRSAKRKLQLLSNQPLASGRFGTVKRILPVADRSFSPRNGG